MKIAIMSNTDKGWEAKVSSHFGKAKYLNILDTQDLTKINIIENLNHHFGGQLSPPKFLQINDIEILIAKELGENAYHSLKRFGIKILMGAEGTIKDTIEKFTSGKLIEAKVDSEKIHPSNDVHYH